MRVNRQIVRELVKKHGAAAITLCYREEEKNGDVTFSNKANATEIFAFVYGSHIDGKVVSC